MGLRRVSFGVESKRVMAEERRGAESRVEERKQGRGEESLGESWRRRGVKRKVEEMKQRTGEESLGESWQKIGVERRKEEWKQRR